MEAHIFYSKMLEKVGNRDGDADGQIEQAGEVVKQLAYWSPKLMHVSAGGIDLL